MTDGCLLHVPAHWEIFMSQIQPFAAYSPFMTLDGNHERDWPYSGALTGREP
jgi:hypothetical protein